MTTTPNGPLQPAPAGMDYPPAGFGAPTPMSTKTNTMAVLALVFAFVFAPLGVIFGFVGRAQIRRTGERGRGLATAGIVLGILFVLLGVVAAVVIGVLASRITPSVDKTQVAQEISKQAATQLGATPDSVVCPTDLPGVVGATITCTLTMDGKGNPITATVTSVENGVVNFDIAG